MLKEGQLGIHPPGALGVAFFVHARAECFVGRGGDGITQPLKEAGAMNLLEAGKLRTASLAGKVYANLLEASALEQLPELLFVCCNPDQLALLTEDLTRFIENLTERGRMRGVEDVARFVPIMLVLPNGILCEQMRATYSEQLHESVLMGRLPGVTEEMIDALLDRVVRGISLQAGGRRGTGTEAVYVLESKGSLVFAGGGEFEQQRVAKILGEHGYPFVHVEGVPGTRIEFDKAMITIVLNVGGLIHTVKPDGELLDLRMGDLCKDPSKEAFVRSVSSAVFEVGRASGAYPEDASYDAVWAKHRATILANAGHVTSSLKMFRDALAGGLDGVKLFSNEQWLLGPLADCAVKAGLREEEALFVSLRRQVQQAMARAIHYRDAQGTDGIPGNKTMKLIAQRNITIELFDAGPDNMALVGTLLDDEHLIKLDLNIFLPDEQITRSKLEMIRTPFPVCREVEGLADRLVGLRIERGVLSEIMRRVGGRVGCSHIKELATNLVYFVASHLVRRRAGVDPTSTDYNLRPAEERFGLTKGLLHDSCLAYCQTTPQDLDEKIGIKRVGEVHKHPLPLGEYEASLGVLLRDRLDKWSDRVYLRYRKDTTEHSLTWREFGGHVSRIAAHLIHKDVRRGDRICMISENRAEMFMCELATMSVGAVTVPVFAGYHSPQIAYVLGHARPRFAVVSGKHQLDKIDRDRYPWIEAYYCIDYDVDCEKWGALDFALLTADGGAPADRVDSRVDATRLDDLCMVMYTSGTTGPPKGVRLSHRNLISQQKALSIVWDVDQNDSLLSYLPWHHSFGGLFERFMTLYHGCELCLDDSRGRNIDRLVDNWKAFRPTLFFSVPRVHDMLLTRCREDAAVSDLVFGGRLRFVFTAGASLPAKVQDAYEKHGVPVLEGWGLTETSPCVTLTMIDKKRTSGVVGFPIPGVNLRIDGSQEILVKGPNVMDGYLDDEEATSYVMADDGWFRTGDLGEFTPDGLRILGRKDGAFKLTTGEKVHPLRIENTMVNESPYISLALVVGSGKDFVGALIYPDFSRLGGWAEAKGIDDEQLTRHPAVQELFAAEVARINPMIDVKYQRLRPDRAGRARAVAGTRRADLIRQARAAQLGRHPQAQDRRTVRARAIVGRDPDSRTRTSEGIETCKTRIQPTSSSSELLERRSVSSAVR